MTQRFTVVEHRRKDTFSGVSSAYGIVDSERPGMIGPEFGDEYKEVAPVAEALNSGLYDPGDYFWTSLHEYPLVEEEPDDVVESEPTLTAFIKYLSEFVANEKYSVNPSNYETTLNELQHFLREPVAQVVSPEITFKFYVVEDTDYTYYTVESPIREYNTRPPHVRGHHSTVIGALSDATTLFNYRGQVPEGSEHVLTELNNLLVGGLTA